MNRFNVMVIYMDLETLNTQYNELLNKYEQALQDYILLKTKNEPRKMITIKGQSYWGESELGIYMFKTVEECMNQCKENKQCSGATFNSKSNTCFLRKGDGEIIPSLDTTYAVVAMEKQLLLDLQGMNTQLLFLQAKIKREINNNKQFYESQNRDKQKMAKELEQKHKTLLFEQEKLDKNLNDLYTLRNSGDVTEMKVDKSYWVFSMLGLLFVLFFIVFLVYVSGINISEIWSYRVSYQPTSKL